MLRHKNNEVILCWASNKAKCQGNYSKMCVFDEDWQHVELWSFWSPKMSPFGPMLGSFFIYICWHQERPRAEPVGLRHLFCWLLRVPKMDRFLKGRGGAKHRSMCALGLKRDEQTPRGFAGRFLLRSWLPRRGSRARQGLKSINQKSNNKSRNGV